MTIEQTIEIPASRRMHLDLKIPDEIPTGKARIALTFICEKKPELPGTSKWNNPLLGLAKAKGAKLTVERFIEMQQEEIERENENDNRLWGDK